SPTPGFFLATSPPYVTWLSPVYVLIANFPSGPMSADLVGTIRPELLGLKWIVPPVTGIPLAVTTPVTVASLSEVSTLGLPSPQPETVARVSNVIANRKASRRRKTIMGSIRRKDAGSKSVGQPPTAGR